MPVAKARRLPWPGYAPQQSRHEPQYPSILHRSWTVRVVKHLVL